MTNNLPVPEFYYEKLLVEYMVSQMGDQWTYVLTSKQLKEHMSNCLANLSRLAEFKDLSQRLLNDESVKFLRFYMIKRFGEEFYKRNIAPLIKKE